MEDICFCYFVVLLLDLVNMFNCFAVACSQKQLQTICLPLFSVNSLSHYCLVCVLYEMATQFIAQTYLSSHCRWRSLSNKKVYPHRDSLLCLLFDYLFVFTVEHKKVEYKVLRKASTSCIKGISFKASSMPKSSPSATQCCSVRCDMLHLIKLQLCCAFLALLMHHQRSASTFIVQSSPVHAWSKTECLYNIVSVHAVSWM